MTLYVESNFVLEIVLGQEESSSAERLLAAAEAGVLDLALPSISLSEPITRVTRAARDRGRLINQLNAQVSQLARSIQHQTEVAILRAVPDMIATIDEREMDRLTNTIDRLLGTARLIELDRSSFHDARVWRTRHRLEIEDAIVLAAVSADLQATTSPQPHVFANRNRKDFDNPDIIADLRRFGCELAWSFKDTATRLNVP